MGYYILELSAFRDDWREFEPTEETTSPAERAQWRLATNQEQQA